MKLCYEKNFFLCHSIIFMAEDMAVQVSLLYAITLRFIAEI